MRILPEIWANILCPFSSSTLNIAFGNASRTAPSSSMTSSLVKSDPPCTTVNKQQAYMIAKTVPHMQGTTNLQHSMFIHVSKAVGRRPAICIHEQAQRLVPSARIHSTPNERPSAVSSTKTPLSRRILRTCPAICGTLRPSVSTCASAAAS